MTKGLKWNVVGGSLLMLSFAMMTSVNAEEAPTSTSEHNTEMVGTSHSSNAGINEPNNISSVANIETEKNYNAIVIRKGQWTGESTKMLDDEKQFETANDKLGNPIENPGLYRGIAKTFLGWSDKEPVGNGEIAEGAKFYSSEDTISTVFPDGIPKGAELYGVYFSLNEPNDPFPTGNLNMGFALLNGINKLDLTKENSITISGNDIVSEKVSTQKDEAQNSVKSVYRYEKRDDSININEIYLESEFKMKDNIAMLVYKDPGMGYGYNKVLSRNYPDKFSENGNFEIEKDTQEYTYVDLNVSLDERLTVPNQLYLEFEGYSWRPLYVFGSSTADENDRTRLEILNPENDENLGTDKNSFSSLIQTNTPKVAFGVNTMGRHYLSIRVILRHDKFKIREADIQPEEGKTVAETILKNMKLRVLPTSELAKLKPNTDKSALNQLVLKVLDEEAKKLTDNDVNPLKVSGGIKGVSFVDGGSIGSGFFTVPLKRKFKISNESSNELYFKYVALYNEIYKFESIDKNVNLPEEIIQLKPINVEDKNSSTGKEIILPQYDAVRSGLDTWNFKGWYMINNDGTEVEIKPNSNGELSATISFSDIYLVGKWKKNKNNSSTFEPDMDRKPDSFGEESPQKPQQEDSEVLILDVKPHLKEPAQEELRPILPKTGARSITFIFGVLTLFIATSLTLPFHKH